MHLPRTFSIWLLTLCIARARTPLAASPPTMHCPGHSRYFPAPVQDIHLRVPPGTSERVHRSHEEGSCGNYHALPTEQICAGQIHSDPRIIQRATSPTRGNCSDLKGGRTIRLDP